MEGTADSHSELMHCALRALPRSSSTSSPNFSSIAAAAASAMQRDEGAPFFNQAFKSHSNNQALFQHQDQSSSYSGLFQQSSLDQDASYHQSCAFLQSNSHARSVSQPSSFFQSLWQSPSLHPGASIPYHEGMMRTKDDTISAAASPSSEPSYKAASPSEVSMSDYETSPAVSGHSIPPLPPLSPSPSNYQSAMKKNSTDLNQQTFSQTMRKGHRRSHSEVPLGISTGKESFFGRPLPFAQLEASIDEVPLHKLNRSSSNSRKELHRVSGRIVMEVVGEREGEGVDDVLSTYISVGKNENCHNIRVADGLDGAVSTQFLKKRGILRAPPGAEYTRVLSSSLQELSDSDKEESDREEDSFMGDSNERVVEDCNQKGWTAKGGACDSRHQRSASMDNLPHSMFESDDAQRSSGAPYTKQVRHHHSLSIDGSLDTKLNFLNAEIDGVDMKKIMADDKLTEIALMDPKRAKRILANRQSAARSKERKVRYISELERKVQTLQTEATTLSAQLTLMQRDSTGLTNENNELKLRLQIMEQQAQLREALHEALREEVQRLKLSTGQISGQVLNHQFYHIAHQSSQLAPQKVEQQHPQPQFQQQSQASSSSSSLHQSSTQMRN